MSIASLDRAPLSPVAPAPAATATPTPRRLQAVPTGTEARGFALYVGLDEFKALDSGTDLSAVVEQLKSLLTQLVPSAESYAAVALAPVGAGGRDLEVVRLALQDPAALARHRGFVGARRRGDMGHVPAGEMGARRPRLHRAGDAVEIGAAQGGRTLDDAGGHGLDGGLHGTCLRLIPRAPEGGAARAGFSRLSSWGARPEGAGAGISRRSGPSRRPARRGSGPRRGP